MIRKDIQKRATGERVSYLAIKATRESELPGYHTENPTEVISPPHTYDTVEPTHTVSTIHNSSDTEHWLIMAMC